MKLNKNEIVRLIYHNADSLKDRIENAYLTRELGYQIERELSKLNELVDLYFKDYYGK